jgi:methylamine utilization protein MauE
MSVLVGPFAIATCLLAVAGFAKMADPLATAGALGALRLPHHRWMVRVGGGTEGILAVAALVTGNAALAGFVALSYLAFAVFVVAALRAGVPISTCGCFGKIDTPPHPLHVMINLLAAGTAVGLAVDGGTPIMDVLADQPLAGVPFVLLVVVGVGAAALAMSALPRTLDATRSARA